ncbi:hypothetical protein CEXT_40171, partial [Caerostris extrusa]
MDACVCGTLGSLKSQMQEFESEALSADFGTQD